ncbi:transmembrane protein, putative [Medicago truncatula]|uniref:Transmembrane protein, putative n=1 Tax=Medicago truncatula TaxID=3880 RepID=G7JW92_MEDTR|nr:transmembrane protein, putative [Medicago truncatula]
MDPKYDLHHRPKFQISSSKIPDFFVQNSSTIRPTYTSSPSHSFIKIPDFFLHLCGSRFPDFFLQLCGTRLFVFFNLYLVCATTAILRPPPDSPSLGFVF